MQKSLIVKLAEALRFFPMHAFDLSYWIEQMRLTKDELTKAWSSENTPGAMSILLNRINHPQRNLARKAYSEDCLTERIALHNHDLSDEFTRRGECTRCADIIRTYVPLLSGDEIESGLNEYAKRVDVCRRTFPADAPEHLWQGVKWPIFIENAQVYFESSDLLVLQGIPVAGFEASFNKYQQWALSSGFVHYQEYNLGSGNIAFANEVFIWIEYPG